MYIVFLVILMIFALIPTVDALIEKKKPKKEVVFTEKMWCREKYLSIAFLWGVALAVFIMCFIAGISLEDIGFRPISFDNGWLAVTALVLWGLAVAFFLYQTILPLASAKQRAEAKKAIAATDETMARILPRSKKQKWIFSFLAFSAGTCEEILYRGFFVFLLQAIFPDIPLYLIVLISTVIFGIGHFYQGVQGVIKTGVMGALLMCLFLATDSLIPVMALHFLMDFSSTFLLSEEQS